MSPTQDGFTPFDAATWLQWDMQGQRTGRIGSTGTVDISLTQDNDGVHQANFEACPSPSLIFRRDYSTYY
jgi:hypothetical protein